MHGLSTSVALDVLAEVLNASAKTASGKTVPNSLHPCCAGARGQFQLVGWVRAAKEIFANH